MIAQVSQADFYREFLMGRNAFDPRDFGVNFDKDEFVDKMIEEFNQAFRGELTIDELLLHPRSALRFCDDVRYKHQYHDLPDDIILRSILNRRKHPG